MNRYLTIDKRARVLLYLFFQSMGVITHHVVVVVVVEVEVEGEEVQAVLVGEGSQ